MILRSLRNVFSVKQYTNVVSRSASDWARDYLSQSLTDRRKFIDSELISLFGDSKSVQSGRSTIDRLLSKSKGGFSVAMHIREDIPDIVKQVREDPSASATSKPYLATLSIVDDCVRQWLNCAMCVDSLELRRISFDQSSGNVLEKIAKGESVHRVRSLNELKRRLHDGRCCYALFHHCLPEDPLVFVHIGLCSKLADSLSSLENTKISSRPTAAMFYSINSPHAALSGLDLAAQLLKEVVPVLQAKYPSLTTFSTLSPIPNFVSWLGAKAKNMGDLVIPAHHVTVLDRLSQQDNTSTATTSTSGIEWLYKTLSDKESSWVRNEKLVNELKETLMWLGSHYIACEKLKKGTEVLPLDPVARFHLRNGAQFHRLNWMGNPSTSGLLSSAGLMVNYMYDASLEETAKRAITIEKTQIVQTGQEVKRILNI